ncbi:phosphoribosyltransferase family protein [Peptococcus simiae]|uniref:Phosphoribosyltransferase family protein n=1 Tax=Peptococcus simiae TaxID=1643805 RepID=A0ABW9GX84_9FIRM
MRKFINIGVAGVERRLPLYQVDEDTFEAVFTVFNDVELTKAAATELLDRVPAFDCILTEETQGVPLAYEMTRQAGLPRYIVARKQAKAHMDDVVAMQMEGTEDVPLDVRKLYLSQEDAAFIKGKRVLLVDDCVLYGSTMYALNELVEALGGYTTGKATIMVQEDASLFPDLVSLVSLPVYTADQVADLPMAPIGQDRVADLDGEADYE